MSKSKRKGTDAEVAVRDYLKSCGFIHAERLATAGSKDKGDITGIPGVVIEVKACKEFDLGGWLKELEVEMGNAGVNIGAVWGKRRLKGSPADWFVIMPGAVFADLLKSWTD